MKGLLALIVLAAAAAIGAITGYIPASGYTYTYNGGLDALYSSGKSEQARLVS